MSHYQPPVLFTKDNKLWNERKEHFLYIWLLQRVTLYQRRYKISLCHFCRSFRLMAAGGKGLVLLCPPSPYPVSVYGPARTNWIEFNVTCLTERQLSMGYGDKISQKQDKHDRCNQSLVPWVITTMALWLIWVYEPYIVHPNYMWIYK